jgi:hypothetical protein
MNQVSKDLVGWPHSYTSPHLVFRAVTFRPLEIVNHYADICLHLLFLGLRASHSLPGFGRPFTPKTY